MPRSVKPKNKSDHTEELTLRLDGALITPEEFRKAVHSFTELLLQVTDQISGSGKKPLWNMSVREGSSVFVATAVLDAETVEPARKTIKMVRSGIGLLNRGKSEVPFFTPRAMVAARGLAELVAKPSRHGITAVELGNGDGKTQKFTEKIAEVVKKNVGAVKKAFGSIEGKLSTLSERGSFQFVVYDALSDRGINCFVKDDVFPDAHAAFGKRVCVRGLIQYDRNNKPVSIDAEKIRVLRSNAEIGPVEQFCGILA
jgi:hypothetical protein